LVCDTVTVRVTACPIAGVFGLADSVTIGTAPPPWQPVQSIASIPVRRAQATRAVASSNRATAMVSVRYPFALQTNIDAVRSDARGQHAAQLVQTINSRRRSHCSIEIDATARTRQRIS
jgi:hypothetical protein